MNYSESLKYLDSVIRSGIKYDLVNIRRLLALLDHPERSFPVVCVAGTNGKGSVCAFLESILTEAGYKVGLNTSPHLVTPRERMRVNRNIAGKESFAEAITEVRKASETGWRPDDPGRPTFFETMTAASLVYFRRVGVDMAILETGLGGRLDGTNATQPDLSIITRIAIDHPKTLGSSLAKIAFEKAGIARCGKPLLIGKQRPPIGELLAGFARFRGALPIQAIGQWHETARGLILSTPRGVYSGLKPGLSGSFQKENTLCAVRAAEILRTQGFTIDNDAVRRGLAKAEWPGRLEYLEIGRQRVLLDCAHNPNAMREFVRELESYPARRRILIYGAMGDKNIGAILKLLLSKVDSVLLPPLPQNRAADPEDIAQAALDLCPDIRVVSSVSEAWKAAKKSASSEDLIVVTGSLYLVGEFKKATGENPDR